LQAERSGLYAGTEELFFDVNAKLEEQKKDNNQVTLGFQLAISTKPNVVKYLTSGSVTLVGKPEDIKKKLEVNPKTKIPQILFTIYQHVFNSIYMLSSNLNTPYPPPDLLHPMAEKIQILSNIPSPAPAAEKTETTPTATSSPASSTAQPQAQPATATPTTPPTATPNPTASPAQPTQGQK
jgi:predicted component of type VI protein secretion system